MEDASMRYDLGLDGLGLLVLMSLLFGAVAHLILGRGTVWMWLVGALAFASGALIASEICVGDLTEQDIQPILGGLAFDEALLGGLVVGIPVVLVAWFLTRLRHPRHSSV
jgi:hypothetical protein